MRISILTMFPELFDSYRQSPVFKRACAGKIIEARFEDIKQYAGGCFRHIDDSPCGGGNGMIMRIDPVLKAVNQVRNPESHIILLTPKGTPLSQKHVRELSQMQDLVFICGHYEGIDARIEKYADEFLSIGDFILTGGELACMAVTDAIVRLLPGVLRDGATEDESLEDGLLEYPQFTKPYDYNGDKVPDVLMSGNTKEIEKWKRYMSLTETAKYRPDLYEKYKLTEQDRKLLDEYKENR